MNRLSILRRRLSSDAFDFRLSQFGAFAVGLLVFVLGILKLTSMPLTEYQLFMGILLVMAVMLLCCILGFLMPGARTNHKSERHD